MLNARHSFQRIHHCLIFPISKTQLQNLTFPLNKSRSMPGHHLKKRPMMDRSPRCYIPSFVEIGLTVPEKKIFEEFLPYNGTAAILVM